MVNERCRIDGRTNGWTATAGRADCNSNRGRVQASAKVRSEMRRALKRAKRVAYLCSRCQFFFFNLRAKANGTL